MGTHLEQTYIITVMSQWARWRLKSPASRLFAQSFVQAQIKENIKASRCWALWRASSGDRWFPSQRPGAWKMFPFDDVIIQQVDRAWTFSCWYFIVCWYYWLVPFECARCIIINQHLSDTEIASILRCFFLTSRYIFLFFYICYFYFRLKLFIFNRSP